MESVSLARCNVTKTFMDTNAKKKCVQEVFALTLQIPLKNHFACFAVKMVNFPIFLNTNLLRRMCRWKM